MPTTMSSVAGAMAAPAGPRQRSALIIAAVAVLGIVVGGGIWFAARGSGSEHLAEHAATPPPPPPPAPARPDPGAALAARMKAVLGRFASWSTVHAGAPCPDIAALGGDAADPWGHPFALTCTGQPENQVVGLISAGPDGVSGNEDDVASWQLGHDVTDLVRGARWAAAAATPPPPSPTAAAPSSAAASEPPARPTAHRRTEPGKAKPATNPAQQPAKPKSRKGIQLDENGIPIDR